MDTSSYVMFLIFGVALVALDAVIVYRSGRSYLNEVYRDPRASRSMVQLVTVLFVLIVLGVLALISTIDIDTGNQVQNVVIKLGVVLLVLGAAHAATMSILSHIRDRMRGEQLLAESMPNQNQNQDLPAAPATTPVNQVNQVNPIGDEYNDRHPAVSPPIEEHQNRYPTT
ncbi:MAG TPA: hypothetical protein VFV67_20620 [Actinophytocola sp.]|uniref:hypothetical protein n=1 Tax=Actinophytocola sp. TaxID=1872138 RepID=UPI002DB5A164|nr:hypothetical protein [Actinophytocola sp.]HEU5473057.1 hypothetical protein [Actinophytocola sp.]